MSRAKEIMVLTVRDWAKALFARLRAYRLSEVSPKSAAFDPALTGNRLNVVFTAISQESIFGGTATAIRLLRALQPFYKRVRVIVLNEADDDFEPAGWSGWTLDSANDGAAMTVAFLGGDRGAPLRVGRGDRFVATHWTTAYHVKAFIEVARQTCPQVASLFAYLIQDFEPAFYPWSSQYLLADSTYADGQQILAVFNTQLLAEYFRSQGYSFSSVYWFEPRLNARLAEYRSKFDPAKKERLILLYGRPATHRNAFELIVEALHEWSQSYPDAGRWAVVSLGEQHRSLGLASGQSIRSLGKVDLDTYGSLLGRASIGISLMVSPHPSYPPLEMAEFGLQVITNSFANKDLGARSPNITSLREVSPATVARALTQLCERYPIASHDLEHTPVFLGGEQEFPFVKEIAARLGGEGA